MIIGPTSKNRVELMDKSVCKTSIKAKLCKNEVFESTCKHCFLLADTLFLLLKAADEGVQPAGKAAKDAVSEAGKKIPEPGQAHDTTKVAIYKNSLNLCRKPFLCIEYEAR